MVASMNDLSTVKFLDSATAISVAFPDVSQRYAYKKLIDAVKAMKQKTPDVVRADIEVQVSLADAIDEALANGEAKCDTETRIYQVGREKLHGAEVDRWRKLRAIPDDARREYYTDIPKPSRNGILKYWAARCVDIKAVTDKPEAESVEVPEGVDSLDNLPRSHFGCVYADPPWQYGNQGTRAATDNHYGTMTIADLCAMPVSELVADDAHLHLWTTNAFIKESFDLIDAWGFEYRSMFIWVKPQMGIGNYWRVSHEIMLLGIRGNAKRFNDRSLKSWVEVSRTKHSAKPGIVRGMIERASHGPYLELFGRKLVKGWTVFGNQISEDYQSEMSF
jgi:N6-adenosine-specific RNA methylase IME4